MLERRSAKAVDAMRAVSRGAVRFAVVIASTVAAFACDRGDERVVLTVYSPHGKALLSHYEQGFEAANPNVDVQWIDMSSKAILDRVRAERANPLGDVWFGAPTELFQRAAGEQLLEKFNPTWKDAVAPSAKDADDQWYGTYLTAEVIGYNAVQVKEHDAPRDWDAVVDKKWKGRVVLRDPVESGTMRAIFGALLQRSLSQTGKTDSAWAYLRRLDANTRSYSDTPDSLYAALKSGDAWITLYNMPDMATLAQRGGAPVSYLAPSSGTPLLVDAIALIKGAKHREVAQQFIEFVTTPEALKYAADSLQRVPARTDIADSLLPKWVREVRLTVRPMPLDPRLMADSLDGWMRTWDKTVRGSSAGK